jgi:hypothetical protein
MRQVVSLCPSHTETIIMLGAVTGAAGAATSIVNIITMSFAAMRRLDPPRRASSGRTR